jgi:hypothetical protein
LHTRSFTFSGPYQTLDCNPVSPFPLSPAPADGRSCELQWLTGRMHTVEAAGMCTPLAPVLTMPRDLRFLHSTVDTIRALKKLPEGLRGSGYNWGWDNTKTMARCKKQKTAIITEQQTHSGPAFGLPYRPRYGSQPGSCNERAGPPCASRSPGKASKSDVLGPT